MEASTPQPPPPPTQPPDAPEGKASGGRRAAAVLLALLLGFACAVMIAVMVDVGGSPTCEDVLTGEATLGPELECFDGSGLQKTIVLVLGWPGGVLAGIAALLALAYAIRGRGADRIGPVAGVAIGLSVLSIVIGSL